nr:hypothetical protein [Tanacetum cinerariifolium]
IYTLPFDLNNSIDKSWMRTSSTKKQYIDGVEAFIKFNMDFGLEIPTDDPATIEMVNAKKESFDEDDLAKFQELLLDAEKPLYKGCPEFIKLSTIVKLLNLKGKYGTSDKFFTELLGLLKKMLHVGYPGNDIDVFLEPLVDDLHTLFETRVDTYDASTKENFNLQKNVCESLVGTLINVPGKTKHGMNARLDLAELGIKPELFARQEEDKTTLPPAGHVRNRNRPEGCIAEETIMEETIEFFSKYHKTLKTIGIPPDKHVINENEDEKPMSAGKSNEVSGEIYLFKCDWVNHKAGGVKHDPNLDYTLVDLNSLGHKDDAFILASQARQVFYVKDQIDKKLSIVIRTPTKNYKDTYDEVNEEFRTVIHKHNDNILPRVNRHDLGNESQNDYYRTDCEEPI